MILLRTTLLAGVLAASAVAQDVWIVDRTGNGDFTTPQEAVDAAGQRDTILIRRGDYPGFLVSNKSLQILADTGATVRLTSLVEVQALPEGRDVYLSELRSFFSLGGPAPDSPEGGVVLMESCRTYPEFNDPWHPFAPGVRLRKGKSCLVTCLMQAVDVPDDCQSCDAGAGLEQIGSWAGASAYHSQFTGGDGGPGWGLFCFNGGAGGHGVAMSQGLLFTENVGATAGEGGDGCPDGPDGVEYQIGAGALHFKSTTPANQLRVPNLAREGETIKIIVTGTPGHVAWLLESDELQTRFLGANVGNLLLQSPLGVAMLGPIPSSGIARLRRCLKTNGPSCAHWAGHLMATWRR